MTRLLFESRALPVLQNRVYTTAEEAVNCPTGDIKLTQDSASGIVTNIAFNQAIMVYDANYNNEQAHSARFQSHLEAVAHLIGKTIGRRALVEIGCGKGSFLELLLSHGFDVIGFDPTYEGTNPRVSRTYFAPGVAFQGEGLILRHVLEHIPSPVRFLEQLAEANNHRGMIYIEVPCLDWILNERTWFDIFYEHVNYFRLSDFTRIFGRLVHAGHCFGGQYLSIIADLATLRRPDLNEIEVMTFPDRFGVQTRHSQRCKLPEVVWGGASKGVIYTLSRARAGTPVDRIIDINPTKQGKFLPCTGKIILSPADGLRDLPAGSTIYVMNPNYLEEIRSVAGETFRYVGVTNE